MNFVRRRYIKKNFRIHGSIVNLSISQHDAEEARQAKEDIASQLREVERRLRSVEAENVRLSESNETLIAAKRQLEADREELEELRGKVSFLF